MTYKLFTLFFQGRVHLKSANLKQKKTHIMLDTDDKLNMDQAEKAHIKSIKWWHLVSVV